MRAQPVDLIGGYYKDDSLPWSAQDTVNWLPVMAEVAGTRTVKKFSTPPGLKPWQEIGTGPIRGMHDCEGLRLIVSGRYLFRITPAGVGVPIGIIPGVGRVQMTHNQYQTGFQVLVENGQGGGGYVYTTSTDTFAKITDEGYPGSISSDYLDSYILGVEPQGRFWFHSNLADATDYNTLDRYEAEAAPDRIVGLAVSGSEVVVFGQRTTEFYFNSGAATGTFQNRRSSITRGCASRHTIQKLDNSIFWLGDDGVVYRLDAYFAKPVSTRPLEKAISEFNWPEALAYVWEDRGHKVYYLTFPDGQTFGYDVITGLWHRRQSYGMKRWRLSHIIPWGRDWFGGDFQNGRLWQLDWDYYLEGDQPIVSERVSPALADDQSQLIVPNAELIFDTGNGPGTEAIPFPEQPNAMQITGHLAGGFVGDSGTYQYTITNAMTGYTVSISSGSLPPGATINSGTGLVTYAYTTMGSFSWTVRVTDLNGNYVELPDSTMVGVENTWNPALVFTTYALSNANKTVTQNSGGTNSGTQIAVSGRSSGKWYFEVQGAGQFENSPSGKYGIGPAGFSPSGGSIGGAVGAGAGMGSHGFAFKDNVTSARIAAPYPGNRRCMVAFDADTGRLWFGVAGVWVNSGNPATGANPFYTMPAGTYFPMVSLGQVSAAYTLLTKQSEMTYQPPAGFSNWIQF